MSKIIVVLALASLAGFSSAQASDNEPTLDAPGVSRTEVYKFCEAKGGLFQENGKVYSCSWDDGSRHTIACIANGQCIRDLGGGATAANVLAPTANGAKTPQAADVGSGGANALDRSEQTPFHPSLTLAPIRR
jgi:hypothetical protein